MSNLSSVSVKLINYNQLSADVSVEDCGGAEIKRYFCILDKVFRYCTSVRERNT